MVRVYTAGLKRHKIAALGILWGCATPALSATDSAGLPLAKVSPINSSSDPAADLHNFDIPAQPLEAALLKYGAVSGNPALFPSAIVANRTSASVRGDYSAEAALRLLLDGTGLVAEKRESTLGTTFVLKEAGTSVASAPVGVADLFKDQGYPGLVQTRIWQALCADARAMPGGYRVLFGFQVDAAGHVNRVHLFRSSGEEQRDAAIVEILQRVHIDRSPPPALVQHRLTMLLLPNDPHAGSPCGQEGKGS